MNETDVCSANMSAPPVYAPSPAVRRFVEMYRHCLELLSKHPLLRRPAAQCARVQRSPHECVPGTCVMLSLTANVVLPRHITDVYVCQQSGNVHLCGINYCSFLRDVHIDNPTCVHNVCMLTCAVIPADYHRRLFGAHPLDDQREDDLNALDDDMDVDRDVSEEVDETALFANRRDALCELGGTALREVREDECETGSATEHNGPPLGSTAIPPPSVPPVSEELKPALSVPTARSTGRHAKGPRRAKRVCTAPTSQNAAVGYVPRRRSFMKTLHAVLPGKRHELYVRMADGLERIWRLLRNGITEHAHTERRSSLNLHNLTVWYAYCAQTGWNLSLYGRSIQLVPREPELGVDLVQRNDRFDVRHHTLGEKAVQFFLHRITQAQLDAFVREFDPVGLRAAA